MVCAHQSIFNYCFRGERRLVQTNIINNEKGGYLINDSIRIEVELIFKPYTFDL